VAIAAMAGVAVTAVPAFLIITTYRTVAAAVAGQLMSAAFLGTVSTAGAVLALGLFPPGIRFTAFAIPLSIGNSLLGSTAPYVSTWLAATLHDPVAPGYYLLAAATCGTLALLFGLPRREATTVPAQRETPTETSVDHPA
jgi:MHS family proline/betaine transporter-like MFS transporter